MTRLSVVVVALLALVAGGPAAVVAQEATPAADESVLATLGYPELHVTITEDAYQVEETEVPAGLVLLVVENATDEETSADIFGPPAGTSLADFMAMTEASPTPEDEFPAFLYEAVITGGPLVPAGETGYAVVELAAGEWAAAGEGDQEPAIFTVTAGDGTPAAAEEPPADVSVTMQDFAFTGLPEQVPAGRQVWRIDNVGPQPHHLVASRVPDGTTVEQVLELFGALFSGATPGPDSPLQEADFGPGFGLEISSAGQTAWIEVDPAPGTYFIACFIPDRETGMPHVAMGMAAILTVGEGGETGAGEAATPAAGGATGAMAAAVDIADFAFAPAEIEVMAGATVTWTNQDTAPHTATAEDSSFDTGRLDQGASGEVTFDQPGTYPYVCSFHPNMRGTVVVT